MRGWGSASAPVSIPVLADGMDSGLEPQAVAGSACMEVVCGEPTSWGEAGLLKQANSCSSSCCERNTASVSVRPPASSVSVRPPASSVSVRPAASSVSVRPAASSVSVRPAASSVSVRPAASSVSVRPPASSVSVRPAASSALGAADGAVRHSSSPLSALDHPSTSRA